MKPLIHQIVFLSSLFMVIVLGLFTAVYLQSPKPLECATLDPVPMCGNIESTLTESQRNGEILFKIHCMGCHKKNKRMTGPALGQIDTLNYYAWMHQENPPKDFSVLKKWGPQHHAKVWNNIMTKEEIDYLFDYFQVE